MEPRLSLDGWYVSHNGSVHGPYDTIRDAEKLMDKIDDNGRWQLVSHIKTCDIYMYHGAK